jgi:signal transduction histidine kinase
LAIVYKYTTAMKGTVSCESTIGKGTKFVVELPARV